MTGLFKGLPLTPLALLLLLAFLWPVAEVLRWAVYDGGWTLKYLTTATSSAGYVRIMTNSVQLAVTTALISMVLAYPLAYFISRQSPRWRLILLLTLVVTMWVSVLVRTYAWMVMLGREGIANSVLLALGILDEPAQLMFTRGAVYLAMIQILLPITTLSAYTSMASFDRTYYLASRVLGASPLKAFLTVYLPMTLPGLIAGGLLVMLMALGFFITPALVGGPNDMLISNAISIQVTQTMNWNLAAALSSVLLVVGALMVACFLGAWWLIRGGRS